MPLDFSGAALPLQANDIADAAARIGVEEAVIRAVTIVETGGVGGFLADGRPRILFEAHVFGAETGHAFDASHPHISRRSWTPGLYLGGAAEYSRLADALALNRKAALSAASWGAFQVLGRNASVCGWSSVEEFVAAHCDSEAASLRAFLGYCAHAGLVPALRARAWAAFARGYNGPGYAANDYDGKLARAYALAKSGQAAVIAAGGGALRIGMRGPRVLALQQAMAGKGISLSADGAFGRVTELALQRFQASAGLVADGIAGPATLAALGLQP